MISAKGSGQGRVSADLARRGAAYRRQDRRHGARQEGAAARLEGRAVHHVGRCTCSSRSAPADRWITQRLYGGDDDRSARAGDRARGRRRAPARRARRAGRRVSLQRRPRGVRRARAAAPGALRRQDARRKDREAAPARRVHDAHAGAGGQRDPRPRADGEARRERRVQRQASWSRSAAIRSR